MKVIAQQGDTVDELCHRHLGHTAGVVVQTLQLNPGLAALGPVLPLGTTVELPSPAATAAPRTQLVQLWN